MDQTIRYKIDDLIRTGNGDIGKIIGIKIIVRYHINGTGEEDNVCWGLTEQFGFGKNTFGNKIENNIPNTTKITRKPKYYKYRQRPCEGCVFIHENDEWVVEEVEKIECGDSSGPMGSPSHSWVKTEYHCRNLKTNEKQNFDTEEGFYFQVVRKLKKIFVEN